MSENKAHFSLFFCQDKVKNTISTHIAAKKT